MKSAEEWFEIFQKVAVELDKPDSGVTNLAFVHKQYALKLIKQIQLDAQQSSAVRKSGSGELLPCPFCGGEAQVFVDDNYWLAGCKPCGIWRPDQPSPANRHQAVESWNKRDAQQDDSKELLDWLDSDEGSLQLPLRMTRLAGEAGRSISFREAIRHAMQKEKQG